MFFKKAINVWHFWQTVVQMIILIIYGLLSIRQFNRDAAMLAVMLVCCTCEFSLLIPEQKWPAKWAQVNYFLEVVAITYSLPWTLSCVSSLILYYHFVNPTFWMILVGLYTLVMYLPMVKLALVKLKNTWMRILVLAFFVFGNTVWVASSAANYLNYASLLKKFYDSGLAGCPVLLIVILLTMHEWGFHLPHFKISHRVSVGTMIFLILLILLHLCYIAFPEFFFTFSFDSIYSAWQHYSFNLEFSFDIKMVFVALEIGIAEELLMRYCVVNLLLRYFQNSRHQLFLTVLFDGIIFGIWHIGNLDHKTLSATLYQMFSVGSWALFVAAIYLYTDSLLVTMIYHGTYDFICFLYQGSTSSYSTAVPTLVDWQIALIQFVIYAALAYFFISGKRGETIYRNS